MKKYLLFLPCFVLSVAGNAKAMNAKEQLNAMKEIFAQEFAKIDTDKNGVLDKNEYLSYQFENFRSNIIEADGFDVLNNAKEAKKTISAPEKVKSSGNMVELGGVSPALKEMADFDLDFDLNEDFGETDELVSIDKTEDYQGLTLKDVMPEGKITAQDTEFAPEIDLSVSEDASLQDLLADMAQKENPAVRETPKVNPEVKEKQISFMLDTIKKTLPKKIDDITTWTDIQYENSIITYLYQADIDTSSFSDTERAALKESIDTDACPKAYAEMCPKIKPMFIDEGINMKISYQDKKNKEIGFCDFNEKTCKEASETSKTGETEE